MYGAVLCLLASLTLCWLRLYSMGSAIHLSGLAISWMARNRIFLQPQPTIHWCSGDWLCFVERPKKEVQLPPHAQPLWCAPAQWPKVTLANCYSLICINYSPPIMYALLKLRGLLIQHSVSEVGRMRSGPLHCLWFPLIAGTIGPQNGAKATLHPCLHVYDLLYRSTEVAHMKMFLLHFLHNCLFHMCMMRLMMGSQRIITMDSPILGSENPLPRWFITHMHAHAWIGPY